MLGPPTLTCSTVRFLAYHPSILTAWSAALSRSRSPQSSSRTMPARNCKISPLVSPSIGAPYRLISLIACLTGPCASKMPDASAPMYPASLAATIGSVQLPDVISFTNANCFSVNATVHHLLPANIQQCRVA